MFSFLSMGRTDFRGLGSLLPPSVHFYTSPAKAATMFRIKLRILALSSAINMFMGIPRYVWYWTGIMGLAATAENTPALVF